MYYSHSFNSPHRERVLRSSAEVFPLYPVMSNNITVNAVWDTGATTSAINFPLVERCNFIARDTTKLWGVNGLIDVGICKIAIRLPNGLLIPDKRVMICDFSPNIDILIGMDIIALGDFCISNATGQTLFSFVIPSLPTPINLAELTKVSGKK
jgi:hypothetical protein